MAHRWFMDQGTPEWRRVRLGIPTASNFHRIITPVKLGLSAESVTYRNELICERLLRDWIENKADRVKWVERGKLEEPHAAQQFAWTYDMELEPIGFITDTKNNPTMGCSPDRLVVGRNEAVEIKCPEAPTHMGYLLDGVGKDYRAQVQGIMMIGEFDRMHFYSWHQRMPPVKHTVERDTLFLEAFRPILATFIADLDEKTEIARSKGLFQARDWPMVVDPERLTEYLQ